MLFFLEFFLKERVEISHQNGSLDVEQHQMYLASGTSKYRSLENYSDVSLRGLFGRDSFLPKVFFLIRRDEN